MILRDKVSQSSAKVMKRTPESTSSGPKDFARPSGILYEILSTFLWALALAFLLRTFFFQPFHIPTSSMQPALQKGDYIVTSKYAYGYGSYSALPFQFPGMSSRIMPQQPERGDVVVFREPNSGANVVKRIIAFEGESFQMRDGHPYINGEPVSFMSLGQSTHIDQAGYPAQIGLFREQLDSGKRYLTYDRVKNDHYDDTAQVTVPKGHYFVLGDNRDSSADSRVTVSDGGVGMIAQNQLIGRAEFILLSVNEEFSIFKPWSWGNLRSSRFFKGI